MPPMTGRVIAGRYNLRSPIGRGAMGVVWRARDQLLDRDVAVKEVMISALIGADERRNAYQRTLREARTAARLSHRGVVAVYDVAEEDGRPWIIMELVPSQSLDQVLTVDGRLPPLRAARIGQQLLSALAHAHSAGVLHRDVKPSNVLIADERTGSGWEERAVLTDFGIAQFEGDPRLTQTGMVMGSPGFTAPERIRGGDATPASDLWSLGATLYAAVEARGPYDQRGGAITTMSAIINEDAPVAVHAGRLAPLIAALLRREPRDRPTAAAAAMMFSQILPQLEPGRKAHRTASHPPTAPQVPPPVAAGSASEVAAAAPRPGSAPEPSAAQPRPTAPDNPEPALAASHRPVLDEAAPADAGAPDGCAADAGAQAPGRGAADAAIADAEAEEASPEDHRAEDHRAEDDAEADADAAALRTDEADGADGTADADETYLADANGNSAAQDAVQGEGNELEAATTGAGIAGAVLAETADGAESDAEPGTFAGSVAGVASPNAGSDVEVDAGPAGYRPTEHSIPALRSGQAQAPAPELAAPKPTFTAAKPGERSKPTFSAARAATPGGSAGHRPAQTGWSQSGQQQPGWPPPSANTPGWAGPAGTAPMPEGSASYPGPSEAAPDLAAQYQPASGGGRAARNGKRGRGRLAALAAGAVVAAAAIGVGTSYALGHHGNSNNLNRASNNTVTYPPGFVPAPTVQALDNPSSALPAGWATYTVTAAQAGPEAKAGFSIDLPPGWREQRDGYATDFFGPGEKFIDIDLTKHTYSDMLTEARFIEQGSLVSHPGYQRLRLDREPVLGTNGAFWKFTYDSSDGVKLQANDILFIKRTPAGAQSYAIEFRTSNAAWNDTVPRWEKIMRTFRIVPASGS